MFDLASSERRPASGWISRIARLEKEREIRKLFPNLFLRPARRADRAQQIDDSHLGVVAAAKGVFKRNGRIYMRSSRYITLLIMKVI
jgi:hypothetical protein